jgi:hypothetical protein
VIHTLQAILIALMNAVDAQVSGPGERQLSCPVDDNYLGR